MSVSAFPYGSYVATTAETPVVSIQANGDINVNPIGTCYVGQKFRTDGDEVELIAFNGNDTAVTNTWLTSGSASDVWVTFVRTGGTEANFGLSNSPTRYQLNADVKYQLVTTGVEVIDIFGYFEMWDAATNGTKLDDNGPTGILWRAEEESGA